jgi:GxxExxY protein
MSSTVIFFKEESFKIIGACMEVHRNLGSGFLEIVYKEALEHEFGLRNIPYEREKPYLVHYKGITLQRNFHADFILFDKIILEVKGVKEINNEHIAQTINYLKVSNSKLAILVNFGKTGFEYKRLII